MALGLTAPSRIFTTTLESCTRLEHVVEVLSVGPEAQTLAITVRLPSNMESLARFAPFVVRLPIPAVR